MKTIGLSGGISCGKSSVAKLITEMGVPVIDADQVARAIVEPGMPALKEIVETFGAHILHDNGTLNRKALGSIVMQSEEKRTILNRITHPKIRLSIFTQLQEYQERGHDYAVVEAALMVETKSHTLYDALIIVTCTAAIQCERLMAREGFDRATAQKWIASQMPLAEKEKCADILIDNSGSKTQLVEAVKKGWQQLLSLLTSPP